MVERAVIMNEVMPVEIKAAYKRSFGNKVLGKSIDEYNPDGKTYTLFGLPSWTPATLERHRDTHFSSSSQRDIKPGASHIIRPAVVSQIYKRPRK